MYFIQSIHLICTCHTCNRGDEEEEEYDFEYSDEEEEETDVDLENSYYAAKALKQEDPRAAVEAFREVAIKLNPFTTEKCIPYYFHVVCPPKTRGCSVKMG